MSNYYIKISAQEYSTSSCFRTVKKAYFQWTRCVL